MKYIKSGDFSIINEMECYEEMQVDKNNSKAMN